MAVPAEAPELPSFTLIDYAELSGFILIALAFSVLIGLDLFKAFRKGAHWIPGRCLVLSALTIQMMNFVENQSGLLNQILRSSGQLNGEIVKNNLFMLHTSRVMLCVLVAFFLPGMARPGYEEKWTKIGAIGLTVFIDIFSELSSIHKRLRGSGLSIRFFYSWLQAKQVNELSFFVSGTIISITLIWLILLLISAAIASKSIRNITAQKIPIILAEPAANTWKGVEDQVLKSWIVSRSCHPESFIARSELASSAALGVAICILSSVVGWIVQGPKVKFHPVAAFWLKFIITILEVIFILIGWAIIGWRWLTSVAYYGRMRKKETCCQCFRMEDYWTRYIVDQQEYEKLKLRELKVDERISKMFVTKLRKLKVDERVSKIIAKEQKRKTSLVDIFLQCLFWLQCSVVFFSKLCRFCSDLTFGSGFIRTATSKILSRHLLNVSREYDDYKAIFIHMEGLWDQTAETMFKVNRKSIKQAKGIMVKGNKDGENCHALIPFLTIRSGTCTHVGISYLDPKNANAQTGLKFLWRHYPVTPLVVEEYFKYASKRSWKLTVVSLINIIVRLSPLCGTNSLQAYGRDSLQAYYEAWELIDLVDESDPETDNLLSKAADRRFTAIREQSDGENAATTTKGEAAAASPIKDLSPAATAAAASAINDLAPAAAAIYDLAEESKTFAKIIHGKIERGEDTMEDWEKLAAWIALYKLCKGMDFTSSNFEGLMNELKTSLGDIIGCCIEKVGPALVDSSRKWAQGLQKTKLLEAVYIAGKSRGLMEKLKWDPNLPDTPQTTGVPQVVWCQNVVNAPAAPESAMV